MLHAPTTTGVLRSRMEAARERLRANPYRLRQLENEKIDEYFVKLAASAAPKFVAAKHIRSGDGAPYPMEGQSR